MLEKYGLAVVLAGQAVVTILSIVAGTPLQAAVALSLLIVLGCLFIVN